MNHSVPQHSPLPSITLEVGKTYVTRDGRQRHTIARIDGMGAAWPAGGSGAWWADCGRNQRDRERDDDLVAEASSAAVTTPRKLAEIPPPVWDTRPINPSDAMAAVRALCKGN